MSDIVFARIQTTLDQLQRAVTEVRDTQEATVVARPCERDKSEDSEQHPARIDRLTVALSLIAAANARDKAFGGDLFSDPAWHMLLDLYVAYRRGNIVTATSLCIASRSPNTTGLRWINLLHEQRLIVRENDPFDKRRTIVYLSKDGFARMEKALDLAVESNWKLGIERIRFKK
ncbi:hypothetical protein F1C10_01345 [Sphingomonas sp. NBWT7]|uniref:hypothetical protein n=1 Tax=Sphingomonas sp. NBWT7 TaxID=2596913 RepID=UPI001627FF65|nr:hypothetical protein [Sphingomonas sp. NBWT7]QNE30751.1 hypothetical protein F1C10_01345 [Sphingomonas sp. NBWT7]